MFYRSLKGQRQICEVTQVWREGERQREVHNGNAGKYCNAFSECWAGPEGKQTHVQSQHGTGEGLDPDCPGDLNYGIFWYLAWQQLHSFWGDLVALLMPGELCCSQQPPWGRGSNSQCAQARPHVGHCYFISKHIALSSRHLINRKDLSD